MVPYGCEHTLVQWSGQDGEVVLSDHKIGTDWAGSQLWVITLLTWRYYMFWWHTGTVHAVCTADVASVVIMRDTLVFQLMRRYTVARSHKVTVSSLPVAVGGWYQSANSCWSVVVTVNGPKLLVPSSDQYCWHLVFLSSLRLVTMTTVQSFLARSFVWSKSQQVLLWEPC